VHPDDRARLVARIADFTATGSHEGIDYRLVMDDGSIKFIRSTGRKVEGMSGKPPRYFASAQDVTEQEKAFEAIAYRDRLLDAVTTGTAILLAADSIDSGMPEALRTLGESMRLDHIDVFQEAPDLAATIALRYGWVAQDLAVPLHRSSLVGPPAGGSEMTQVRARLGAGEVVISQRGAGPLQALLERMHTQSLLLVPIVVDRQLWGNLGVDSSRVARRWSPIEVDTLKNFASIVGSLVVRNEARLSLEKSEQRFRVLSAAAPDAIVTMDGAGKIRQWNRAAERMLGYDERDAVGRPIHDFMVPERFKADAMRGLKRFLATGEGDALGMTREMGAVRKDGTEVTVEVSLAGVRVEDEWQAIGIIRDITVRKESENKVQFANVLLKTEIEASPDGILVVGPQREILLVNRRFAEMWGIASDLEAMTDEIALKASISGAKHPEAFALRVQYLYDHPDVIGDEEVDLVDGRTIDRRTAGLVTSDGHYLGRVWYFRDITARKNAESLAIRMAHYDVLTGLANRSLFVEALGHAIAEAKRGNDTFGVIYLDLDHFKDVNDTLGHAVGDELLKVVATRLHATVRAVDTAARFGGDEFAVVVSDVDEPAEVGLVADKILSALAQPYSVQGNDIRTSASIGIDLFGPQSADAEALLSHADVALYRAKSEGRGGYRFFTDAMDKEVRTRVTLGSELRTAVAGGQLFLMYQPQVEIESGRITGLEALVRWNHPTRGLLGPGVFIPVAESTGIVVALGQWVLITACRQTKAWLDAGIEPVRVSVNVSGLQFKTPNELEANVAAAFAETGLPAKLLELELTETVLMGVSLQQNESLTRLRQEGVTIAIDDFGTGYSSLGYLIRFPVDRIKIAQDFIRDVTTVPGQAAIAKATIGLAHDLGIDVIAEGVETREQLDALKGWGCPAIQGYYFAKPLSVDEVTLAFRNGGILKPRVPSPT
jgi:diguanylate cyclase (GGDEF)-like protein/PAS domain S-box-containing protein